MVDFLRDLGISIHDAMVVDANIQGRMAMAKDSVFHDRSKHLDLWCHFTCDLDKKGRTSLNYLPT